MKSDKQFTIMVGLLVLVLAAVLVVSWPASSMDNVVSVQGKASGKLTPNEATFVVAVQNKGNTANEAQTINSQKIDAVVAALKELGMDVETQSYWVNPRYNYNDGERKQIGFEAYQSLRVRTTDLEKVNDALSAATTAGATDVQGVSFQVSQEKRESFQEKLYAQAAADARGQAEALANAAGARVGKVASLSRVSNGGGFYPMVRTESAMMDSSAKVVAPENLEVEVIVDARFYLK